MPGRWTPSAPSRSTRLISSRSSRVRGARRLRRGAPGSRDRAIPPGDRGLTGPAPGRHGPSRRVAVAAGWTETSSHREAGRFAGSDRAGRPCRTGGAHSILARVDFAAGVPRTPIPCDTCATWAPQGPDDAHDPRDHHRHLGAGRLRLDGQQDQRPRGRAAARYYAGKITLSDASGAMGGFSAAPMSLATADLVRAVDGVDVVVPGGHDADGRPGRRGRPWASRR